MRTSIVIATHNDGRPLLQTVQSCIESSATLEYEIIIADDGSSDNCPDEAVARFPQIRLIRHQSRQGVSPTRVLGARQASADVLIFLDGHTKPLPGALQRLVEDVELANGEAIVTPAIASLEVRTWTPMLDHVGYGYGLKLETLQRKWVKLGEMHSVRLARRELFESPAFIGAAVALSRSLYSRLRGFDAHMKYWGVEDLELSLKCWLMGSRILHDPRSVIAHRFQTKFQNYEVPSEHVIANHCRCARKLFTRPVWEDWLQRFIRSQLEPQCDRRRQQWTEAWKIFDEGRDSVEQERRYVQRHKLHDEFWYADRFNLEWPKKKGANARNRPVLTMQMGQRSPNEIMPTVAPDGCLNYLSPSIAPSIPVVKE